LARGHSLLTQTVSLSTLYLPPKMNVLDPPMVRHGRRLLPGNEGGGGRPCFKLFWTTVIGPPLEARAVSLAPSPRPCKATVYPRHVL